MTISCVAIVCVRNEMAHLSRVLDDFIEQGIQVAVIDHGSEDGSRELARDRLGRGVIAVRDLSWRGVYDQTEQLEEKRALIADVTHDWVIHADCDEWPHSPRSGESLLEGLTRQDRAGYDAVNFNEFVFLPCGSQLVTDCKRELTNYYYFAPRPLRLMRAWKRSAGLSNVESGGHVLHGASVALSPETFVLRHYIALSQAHVIEKYVGRTFARHDLDRGWHHNRVGLDASRLHFPEASLLCTLPRWDSVAFDTTRPHRSHYWDWPPEMRR
jgi:hypothetical protein